MIYFQQVLVYQYMAIWCVVYIHIIIMNYEQLPIDSAQLMTSELVCIAISGQYRVLQAVYCILYSQIASSLLYPISYILIYPYIPIYVPPSLLAPGRVVSDVYVRMYVYMCTTTSYQLLATSLLVPSILASYQPYQPTSLLATDLTDLYIANAATTRTPLHCNLAEAWLLAIFRIYKL